MNKKLRKESKENQDQDREYGYLEKGEDNKIIKIKKGQFISGYSVGILFLDECWYPTIPGNVANLCSYDFPVNFKKVPNCTTKRILKGDPTLVNDIIAAAKEFEAEGARAICSACGFFGNFQDKVSAAVDIPVFLSSVIQISWIKIGLRPQQKIGMLTAYEKGITPDLFKSCGVYDPSIVVVRGLEKLPAFSEGIMEDNGLLDNKAIRQEVVNAAVTMVKENSDIGAIVLECSDLPPYAADIQRAVKLPVFDFITMIKYIHYATSQKPYHGFI